MRHSRLRLSLLSLFVSLLFISTAWGQPSGGDIGFYNSIEVNESIYNFGYHRQTYVGTGSAFRSNFVGATGWAFDWRINGNSFFLADASSSAIYHAGPFTTYMLGIRDTDRTNALVHKWNENDIADRVLNWAVNGATRTIDLSDNLTFLALTNTRLLGSNGAGAIGSTDLDAWIAGTANQITVADDGDGTVTLSTPQELHAATVVVAASDSHTKWKAEYICDGTNDEVEIQAAIDVVEAAGGGVVQLLGGTYNLAGSDNGDYDGAIFIENDGVMLIGQGRETLLNLADDNGLTLGGVIVVKEADYITVRDLAIDGGYSSGHDSGGIRFLDCNEIRVENCYIHNTDVSLIGLFDVDDGWVVGNRLYNGVAPTLAARGVDIDRGQAAGDELSNNGSHRLTIANNSIETVGSLASKCENATDVLYIGNMVTRTSGNGGGFAVDNNDGANALACGRIAYIGNILKDCGIVVEARTEGVTVSGNTITGGQISVEGNPTDSGAGSTAADVVIDGNYIRDSKYWWTHSNDSGIRIIHSPGNHIISNNVVESPGYEGIQVNFAGNTGTPASVIVTGNQVYDTPHWAFRGISLNRCTISGNKFDDQGDEGIYFEDSDYNIITDNHIYSSAAEGIEFVDSDHNLVSGNYIIDATTAAILESGSADYNKITGNVVSGVVAMTITGANTVIARNFGYVTENSGTATVANVTTHIDVTHSLAITPSINDIAVVPTNNLGNATKFWISDVGATTFRINVDADPGVGTATFAWQIGSY